MSDENPKSNPIPTRYDDETMDALGRINKSTGIPKAEIIRRAVKYALSSARANRSLEFLLGDVDMIEDIFGPDKSTGEKPD